MSELRKGARERALQADKLSIRDSAPRIDCAGLSVSNDDTRVPVPDGADIAYTLTPTAEANANGAY